MTDQPTTPAPGSHEAKRHGCRCSGPQNGYGKGAFTSTRGDVEYIRHPKCPMHPTPTSDEIVALAARIATEHQPALDWLADH